MLELLTERDFDAFFCLMEKSFPDDEYRYRDEQFSLFSEPLYSVFAVRGTEFPINGFLAVWNFDEFAFIEHFAVEPELRGGGIGSAMLSELAGLLGKRICLEVELPNTQNAERRIGFYERNGFYYNEYDYKQPPISNGKAELPLRLMSSGAPLEQWEFEAVRDLLYKKVYKIS